MLAAPVPASCTRAALDLVEDEEDIVLVANFAKGPQPFAAKMVVAALALNRLDDERGNVMPFALEESADLRLGPGFAPAHVLAAQRFGEGKIQARSGHSGPGELCEVIGLA